MLVSIDPGVKLAGVAVWEDGELSSAWLAKGTGWLNTSSVVTCDVLNHFAASSISVATLVIEKPQIYHQSKQKGDPNDLIELAICVGAIAASLRPHIYEVITYLPREWKGTVPKEIMVERIKQKLSPEEHSRVDLPSAKSLAHNIYDAIGIGLHYLGKSRR